MFCGFLADASLSNPSTQEVGGQEDEEFKGGLDCRVRLRSLDKGRGKEKLKTKSRLASKSLSLGSLKQREFPFSPVLPEPSAVVSLRPLFHEGHQRT